MNTPDPTGPAARLSILPAMLVVGFGCAIAMWCVWFITHLPLLEIPASWAGPALLVTLLAAIWGGVSLAPRACRPLVGLGAGLVAGGVNLLLLANRLTEVPDGGSAQLLPSAPMVIGGFLGISALSGLIAGIVARTQRDVAPQSSARWLARFAVITAVAILPLLTLGGLVTSTGSGLAVPDWPGTYGSNMFLYPIGLMAEPRIFLEHSHRLFGTLVGLTAIVLVVFTVTVERRRWVWACIGLLLALIIVQGLLGAGRVTEQSRWLGVLHGVLGQVVFAVAAINAALLSPSFGRVKPGGTGDWGVPAMSGKLRTVSVLAVAATVLQLAFGAMYRHTHAPHGLWSHVGFSIVVAGLVAVLASMISSRRKGADASKPGPGAALDRRVGLLGRGLHASLGLQFVLGFVVLYSALRSGSKPPAVPTAGELEAAQPIEALQSLLRTIHQANGAVLLGLAMLAAAWVIRLASSPDDAERRA